MYRINKMKCNEMKGNELKWTNHCNDLKNKSAAVDGAFRSSVGPVISDQDTGAPTHLKSYLIKCIIWNEMSPS